MVFVPKLRALRGYLLNLYLLDTSKKLTLLLIFPALKFIHGVVDAEKSGDCIQQPKGEHPEDKHRIGKGRHDKAFPVSQHRFNDALYRMIRLEDGKQ